MPSYKEYFSQNRPKPKWFIGDRVFGKWNKIPFTGTVLNDNMIDEEIGAEVHVFLDLPIHHKNECKTIVKVKQRDLKKLIAF
jgi:hypothetical protein